MTANLSFVIFKPAKSKSRKGPKWDLSTENQLVSTQAAGTANLEDWGDLEGWGDPEGLPTAKNQGSFPGVFTIGWNHYI